MPQRNEISRVLHDEIELMLQTDVVRVQLEEPKEANDLDDI